MSSVIDLIPKGEYVCYVLQSVDKPQWTYCGSTNNIKRRIRQHNGEICGGAKATHKNRPWRVWYLVSGFGTNQKAALRYEWFCKIKHNKFWLKSKKGCSHRVKRMLISFKGFQMMDKSLNLQVISDDKLTELIFKDCKLKT